MLNRYGLKFSKQKLSDGYIMPFVTQITDIGGAKSLLGFIGRLDSHDCSSFIYDLNRCLKHQTNVDEGFFSDSVENMTIIYQYPNVDIDDILVIPMLDLKRILEEWLEFIS